MLPYRMLASNNKVKVVIHTLYLRDVPLQFVHTPENVRFKVFRDMVGLQYFLPTIPFKPGLLINTPFEFTEDASRQAEKLKCLVRQFTDFVGTPFPNNHLLAVRFRVE